MSGAVWYRYEDYLEGDEYSSYVRVALRRYAVLKETPKGVWIMRGPGWYGRRARRFVLRDARKRFACPTPEEAAASFRARKERQRRIYMHRVAHAEQALELIDEIGKAAA